MQQMQIAPPNANMRPADKIPIPVVCSGGSGAPVGSWPGGGGGCCNAAPGATFVLGDGGVMYQGFTSSPPPGMAGGGPNPTFYSSSPPAPGLYASPPIALSPPSMQVLTLAMGGTSPPVGHYGPPMGSSPPMGYGGSAPMAFSPPAQQMGQPMLFTSPYGAPYGVQMAVSPPTREACAFGGYAAGSEASMSIDGSADYSAQMMYAQPQQQHWDGSGQAGEQQQYAPMATDESGYYAAQQPAAHGYYGADGGFYHGMHPQQGYIAAQPPQYYAHPGACANGACGSSCGGALHAPPMTLRVNTTGPGGDANGGFYHPGGSQPGQQGGGGRPRNNSHGGGGGGRGSEGQRRRSKGGGGHLQHNSGSGSSATSFGSDQRIDAAGLGGPQSGASSPTGSQKSSPRVRRRSKDGKDKERGKEELSFEELSFDG